MKLRRTVQCKHCPWKISTDSYDIPDGYCEIKHSNLKDTIAIPGEINIGNVRAMACHHSEVGNEDFCIGWLNHQLGIGNNIGLRLQMLHCENIRELKTIGEQHQTFEDTLPK